MKGSNLDHGVEKEKPSEQGELGKGERKKKEEEERKNAPASKPRPSLHPHRGLDGWFARDLSGAPQACAAGNRYNILFRCWGNERRHGGYNTLYMVICTTGEGMAVLRGPLYRGRRMREPSYTM